MKNINNSYLIIGSGFSGSVIAERIASQLNEKVLVIEQRNHIGGNCYDSYDENGVLIHNYGPHIFHTDYEDVWNYLSGFTEWNSYQHKVLANVKGENIPLPFNLKSIQLSFTGKEASEIIKSLLNSYKYGQKIPVLELLKSEDRFLKMLGDYVYENVFLNYTVKQWGLKPDEIDPSVTARVPVYLSEDDRYFQDKYQGLPKLGYHKLFEKMLQHPNIEIRLNTKMSQHVKIDHDNKKILVDGEVFQGKLIFTGLIDELFEYKFGELPYRTLIFENEHYQIESFQDCAVINYPNDFDYTRITEYKKMTLQRVKGTTITREYPKPYQKIDNTPYYPIFTEQTKKLYQHYLDYAKNFKNLVLIGRLAEYKYYDMDDAVKRALDLFESLRV